MIKIFHNFRLLFLAIWLGAAIFFSFGVAPSAFGVIESRELAGSVVSRTLMIVNFSGLIIGAILILTSFFWAEKGFRVWIERLFLLVFAASCAVGQLVIATWLQILRSQIGKPVEELALDDPSRIRFDQLHGYSVTLLMIAMIASLLAFLILSFRAEKTVSTITNKGMAFDGFDTKF